MPTGPRVGAPTTPWSSCTTTHYRRLVRLVGAAGRRRRDRGGGRAGLVRRDARPVAVAARAREGPGLPAADGGQPVPVGAAAPRGRGPARRTRRSPSCPGPTRTPWPPSDAGAVLDALQRLPDRQREVLALRYYLDLSEAEIAETLGISRGAVKSHASRGAAALRTLMEDVS